MRRIYLDYLPGRFKNSWLKRQAAIPPARSRRTNVCGDGEVAMTNQTTVPAIFMAYRPRDYFGGYDLMTRVKGTHRRKLLRNALESGNLDQVPPAARGSVLTG